MNHITIGFRQEVELPAGPFLLITDEVPDIYRARVFDPAKDCFNPLKGISYRKARELAEVLYVITPGGENTLTVRNGRRELLKSVMTARRFDKLKGTEEVEALISDILQSPVLRRVLCSSDNQFSFSERSRIVARINRAELGEFDAFVLGALLMNHYQGTVVVDDLGFYGRDVHCSLIRENRFVARVNFLKELPEKLRKSVLSITDKKTRGCLFEDAELLAKYAGHIPGTNAFNDFVSDAMGISDTARQ